MSGFNPLDLNAAAQFLSRVVPWPNPGEPGYVNLHWTFEGQDNKERPKTFWSGRATRTLQEAIGAIVWALQNTATRDIYFCTSLQREAREKVNNAGEKYLVPVRNQPNAISLKSMFLDVDVKEGGYATLADALGAIKKLVDDVPLPAVSCFVHSGGGLHVYWFLERPIDPQTWRDHSLRLVGAAENHGLKFDRVCSIDCARILREPQTWNCKGDQRRLVKLLGIAALETDLAIAA
jgi:hypothetical protein